MKAAPKQISPQICKALLAKTQAFQFLGDKTLKGFASCAKAFKSRSVKKASKNYLLGTITWLLGVPKPASCCNLKLTPKKQNFLGWDVYLFFPKKGSLGKSSYTAQRRGPAGEYFEPGLFKVLWPTSSLEAKGFWNSFKPLRKRGEKATKKPFGKQNSHENICFFQTKSYYKWSLGSNTYLFSNTKLAIYRIYRQTREF